MVAGTTRTRQAPPLRSAVRFSTEQREKKARERAARSAGRRGAAALGTSANSFSAGTAYAGRRRLRMKRRGVAQMFTDHDRFASCGRSAFGAAVHLRLSADGVAGVAGVETCGSVWCCSVCSATIAHRRQEELSRGLNNWWSVDGRQVVMLTLTMRHNRGHRLRTLWDALSYAWNGVTSGRQWSSEKAQYGLKGWTRVVEVTHGRKGWHVHIHALLFLDRTEWVDSEPVTPRDLHHWKTRIAARWSNRLERKGFTALADVQDMRLVADGSLALSDYFTKQVDNGEAVAREVTQGHSKTAHAGNRTPFAILDDVIRTGDAGDAALWQEFVTGSQGRRQMTWGKGTRELLGITEEEQTDEEIAAEEVGTEEDNVIVIPARGWFWLSADGDRISDVLEALEDHGPDAALHLLQLMGVPAAPATPEGLRDLGLATDYNG